MKELYYVKQNFCNFRLIKKILSLFIIILTVNSKIYSQGHLVMIGGESENQGGWSDTIYRWAINHSTNKRVAIISFTTSTNWLKNYFISLGAQYAKDFVINSTILADSQDTYDTLITYSVIFIKGGDQYNYYSTYKGKKINSAFQQIYDNGGVLCGTSAGCYMLSDIIFTAAQGSVYPDECIINPHIPYIQLKDDFINTIPNYIFDTHFVERGRMGRLIAFMANWYFNHNQTVKGIGVDDKTAICIEPSGIGYVYGTAAVNIFENTDTINPYDSSPGMIRTRSLKAHQLLHNCTYNFKNGEITGLNDYTNPVIVSETGNYTILLSGQDDLVNNQEMLNYFINKTGSLSDKILIITGVDKTLANNYKSYITGTLGNSQVEVYSGLSSSNNDIAMTVAINTSKKIVFLNNTYEDLKTFLDLAGNGSLLKKKLFNDNINMVFVGDNSRFAGTTFVDRYLSSNASYNGSLQFKKGLSLLKTFVVMPNTYTTFLNNDEYWENTNSGLQYAMIKDTIKRGIWITGNTFVSYYVKNKNGYIKPLGGTSPLMVLTNNGTNAGLCSHHNVNWSTSRNIAGFQEMKLEFLNSNDSIQVGLNIDGINNNIDELNNVIVYPNPVIDYLNISVQKDDYIYEIIDITGKYIEKSNLTKTKKLLMSNYDDGVYILKITNINTNTTNIKKIILNKKVNY